MIAPGASQQIVSSAPADRHTLGYDAARRTHRRRAPQQTTRHEDSHLDPGRRKKLTATVRDVVRNFALAGWIIRKHLDYTTSFSFQAETPDSNFNNVLEAWLTNWTSRYGCHTARRHPLPRLLRMAEARRIVDGDILLVKMAAARRGTIQTIESDRLINPADPPTDQTWINGVRTDRFGAPLAYHVADRGPHDRLIDGRIVPARNALLHAYHDSVHRFDLVRGISPFSSSLNSLRDAYEGFDLCLAKLRLHQLFGLKITRDQYYSSPHDEVIAPSHPIDTDTDDAGNTIVDEDGPRYEVDLAGGPFKLEMDRGEDMDFIESKTPATETVEFLKTIVHLACKSLNIPLSFYDESSTNFFGSRGALLHYLRSARTAIRDNRELLDDLTRWRIGIAVFDGELTLPPNLSFDTIRWSWIPDGVPWWDPSKEVRGNALAIAAGLDNLVDVCRSTGTDFRDNVDKNAAALAYARERDVPIILPGVGAFDAPEPAGLE